MAHCIWQVSQLTFAQDGYKITIFTSEIDIYLNPLTRSRQKWLDDQLRPIDELLSWHYCQCVLTYFKAAGWVFVE